jgi:hypothetical protein
VQQKEGRAEGGAYLRRIRQGGYGLGESSGANVEFGSTAIDEIKIVSDSRQKNKRFHEVVGTECL